MQTEHPVIAHLILLLRIRSRIRLLLCSCHFKLVGWTWLNQTWKRPDSRCPLIRRRGRMLNRSGSGGADPSRLNPARCWERLTRNQRSWCVHITRVSDKIVIESKKQKCSCISPAWHFFCRFGEEATGSVTLPVYSEWWWCSGGQLTQRGGVLWWFRERVGIAFVGPNKRAVWTVVLPHHLSSVCLRCHWRSGPLALMCEILKSRIHPVAACRSCPRCWSSRDHRSSSIFISCGRTQSKPPLLSITVSDTRLFSKCLSSKLVVAYRRSYLTLSKELKCAI